MRLDEIACDALLDCPDCGEVLVRDAQYRTIEVATGLHHHVARSCDREVCLVTS